MKEIIIIIGIVFLSICIIYCMGQRIKKLKKDKKELQKQLEKKTSDLAYIMKHLEKMNEIKQEDSFIKNKIEGAKTDEEINSIVSVIISANNDRVQDNKDKK